MNNDSFGEYAREGREAFENKIPLSHCPYAKGDDSAMAWDCGWDMAGLEQQHREERQ